MQCLIWPVSELDTECVLFTLTEIVCVCVVLKGKGIEPDRLGSSGKLNNALF